MSSATSEVNPRTTRRFANAVRFWGKVNPDFFKGTVVEKQAAEVLAQPRAAAAG